jgi:hypothetical protein
MGKYLLKVTSPDATQRNAAIGSVFSHLNLQGNEPPFPIPHASVAATTIANEFAATPFVEVAIVLGELYDVDF